MQTPNQLISETPALTSQSYLPPSTTFLSLPQALLSQILTQPSVARERGCSLWSCWEDDPGARAEPHFILYYPAVAHSLHC